MKSVKLLAALLALALLVVFVAKPHRKAPSQVADSNATSQPIPGITSSVSSSPALGQAHITPASANLSAPAATPVASRNHPALTEFNDWARRFTEGEQPDLTAGERLALNRRHVMLHLIKTDAEQALAQTVPARWRRDLPQSITQHFEERVDGRGSFTVMVGTDFERSTREVFREAEIDGQIYAAFPFGWRKTQMSQTSIPIHGIAIDNNLAMLSDPIRLLEPEEVEAAGLNPGEEICGVSEKPADSRQQPVAADTGGRVRFFCGADHYRLVNEQWLAAEGGPGGGGQVVLPDAWTQGTKTVLYMRVNFPDDLSEPISEANAYNVMVGVNSFFTEGSYNTTALVPTVTPLMTLPHTKGYYSAAGAGALLSDARQAARDAGFETDNYDRDIVAHTSVPGFESIGSLMKYPVRSNW